VFKNYLKVAWRNIVRHKGYSFINIFGLAVGLACCLLIMLRNLDELSYDRFYPAADHIYRIATEAFWNNNNVNLAACSAPLAGAIRREIPEVEAVTRCEPSHAPVLRYHDKVFSEERFFRADPTFFEVFQVSFIKGDPKTALNKPNSIVLSRSQAQKYFAGEEPMGKTLNVDNQLDYIVTGVFADMPRQTHFHYDFIAPFGDRRDTREDNWVGSNFHTYFRVRPGVTQKQIEEKLGLLLRKYVQPQVEKLFGMTWSQIKASGAYFRWVLQPLTSIHLHSHRNYEIEPNSNIIYVYIFSLIAFGVFILACVNFINLTTARAATRSCEVGIRKAIGSSRGMLIQQFLTETFLLVLLAIIIAVTIVHLLQPLYNRIAGESMALSVLDNSSLLPLLTAMLLLCGLIAGTYPALYLASFQPTAMLKGDHASGRKTTLRGLLVVFQFAVSIVLIIGTIVVYRQLRFIQNRNLGFNKEQVLVIRKANDLGEAIRAFKQELLGHSAVASVCNSSNLMGDSFFDYGLCRVGGASGVSQIKIMRIFTDEDFAKVYRLTLASGRFFEKDRQADLQGVVLNEASARALQLSDPVGKELIGMDGSRWNILGVAKDFHFQSLHHNIQPLAIYFSASSGFGTLLSVRVNTGDIRGTIAGIERSWRAFSKGQAFEYEFFDERFAKVYAAEERTANLLLTFSILAIFIAGMGLLGLSALATQQRTKEIGIRKVLGASILGISRLLSQEFLKFVLLANIIAWPLAYLLMRRWLADFAYRTALSLWIFIFSGILVLAIALLTVSYQAIRAARANPVESLRYE
jgi:putative ABC transport system permease protein